MVLAVSQLLAGSSERLLSQASWKIKKMRENFSAQFRNSKTVKVMFRVEIVHNLRSSTKAIKTNDLADNQLLDFYSLSFAVIKESFSQTTNSIVSHKMRKIKIKDF